MTRQAAAHFLDQASFGPTPADVDLVMTGGYQAWLEAQFAMPESPVPDATDITGVRAGLMLNMANAPDQLRQRMLFALSQIIVVSSNKNGSAAEMTPWVRLLSRNAFGSYRTLLREVTLSAPMGKYLDNWLNRCTRDQARVVCPNGSATSTPNENFARELMQLFSLGLFELNPNGTVKLTNGQPTPTYTQQNLVEYARALTGWTYARTNNVDDFSLEMVPAMVNGQPRYHDTGQKELLSGVVAPASGNTTAALYADVDSVVASIMAHPNVAPFVSSRLIRSLVTSNPSPAYIQRVAAQFTATDGDLRAVATAILTDPEARAFTSTDGRLKDPILHVLGLGRALGVTLATPANIQGSFSSLQQSLLTPSTVFSYYNLLTALPGNLALMGPEFGIYPPALAVQRANFLYRVLDGQVASSLPVVLDPFIAVAASSDTLVDLVNQTLMFGRMSSDLRSLIVAATNAITGTSAYDMRQRALGALYLAAVSSEYSVYSDTSVTGASSVQPPTGVAVSSLAGATVSISWRAPLIGPAPTSYVLEGGVRPGETIATIPIGGTTPSFTFQAPPGAYYVRLRTVSNGTLSRPSSEVRVYVGGTSGPTAPRQLTAYGNGNSVVLNWRNTFAGGEPTGITIDVAQNGARVASIPMPVTDRWDYNAVPPGTFAFTVRATNVSGTSGSSNSVTLTFPLSGCTAPGVPTAFSLTGNGRSVAAYWIAPASGTTPTHYTVEAQIRRGTSGSTFDPLGMFAVTGTAIGSPIGPGRYRVRVRSENICGSSGYTQYRTVDIQ
ncbi:MAG: DUF1800 family protein [Acidobacteria bacterium]|nr:DUF1800 family protein [Acidobacteriota bacterium]